MKSKTNVLDKQINLFLQNLNKIRKKLRENSYSDNFIELVLLEIIKKEGN